MSQARLREALTAGGPTTKDRGPPIADGILTVTPDTPEAVEWRSRRSIIDSFASCSTYLDEDDDGPQPSDLYGRFTWKIEKFSEVSKRELRSNTFEVGGYKWYILVYPQGCDVANHLSLFLCVADYDRLLPGWNHFAQFTIAVANCDPKSSKYSDTLHRFSKKEHDWGWKKFMELGKLGDGFTPGDTLVIKAQVQVLRDRPAAPLRCLDAQYRRELVRVYLNNVEGIARRFVEERRAWVAQLLGMDAGWHAGACDHGHCDHAHEHAHAHGHAHGYAHGHAHAHASAAGFRGFWATLGEAERRRLSRESAPSLLKAAVKRFFNEKEVTSTLLMDGLVAGCKAMEAGGRARLAGERGDELGPGAATIATASRPATGAVLIDAARGTFFISGDVVAVLEGLVSEALPGADRGTGPGTAAADGARTPAEAGDESGRDALERDEGRLAELGRRIMEVFAASEIARLRLEAAWIEAETLKRQEELIREEEASSREEQERAAARQEAERERRSRKKEKLRKRKEEERARRAAEETARAQAEASRRAEAELRAREAEEQRKKREEERARAAAEAKAAAKAKAKAAAKAVKSAAAVAEPSPARAASALSEQGEALVRPGAALATGKRTPDGHEEPAAPEAGLAGESLEPGVSVQDVCPPLHSRSGSSLDGPGVGASSDASSSAGAGAGTPHPGVSLSALVGDGGVTSTTAASTGSSASCAGSVDEGSAESPAGTGPASQTAPPSAPASVRGPSQAESRELEIMQAVLVARDEEIRGLRARVAELEGLLAAAEGGGSGHGIAVVAPGPSPSSSPSRVELGPRRQVGVGAGTPPRRGNAAASQAASATHHAAPPPQRAQSGNRRGGAGKQAFAAVPALGQQSRGGVKSATQVPTPTATVLQAPAPLSFGQLPSNGGGMQPPSAFRPAAGQLAGAMRSLSLGGSGATPAAAAAGPGSLLSRGGSTHGNAAGPASTATHLFGPPHTGPGSLVGSPRFSGGLATTPAARAAMPAHAKSDGALESPGLDDFAHMGLINDLLE